MLRKCDVCEKEYHTRAADIRRGWGLTCSKSCAAKKREMSKPGYDPEIVARNNRIRKGDFSSCSYERIESINMKRFGVKSYIIT